MVREVVRSRYPLCGNLSITGNGKHKSDGAGKSRAFARKRKKPEVAEAHWSLEEYQKILEKVRVRIEV